MYAVVATGGKQVKVSQGDVVRVEKLGTPAGEKIELDSVRLVANDSGVVVDPQALAGARVVCEVLREGRGKKIRVFKYKRRKNYRRTQGHRQAFTELKVLEIKA